jgi:hypothetical protein
LKDLGIDGRMILKLTLKTEQQGTEWINMAHDRGKWWALVKMVKNLLVT